MDKTVRVGNKLHYVRQKIKAKRDIHCQYGNNYSKMHMPWFDKYKGENKHLSLSDYIYSENGLLISIDVRL